MSITHDTHGFILEDDDPPNGSGPQNCECPFPWLLLLLGTAVGGGVGYYVGRRGAQTEDGDAELGPGR